MSSDAVGQADIGQQTAADDDSVPDASWRQLLQVSSNRSRQIRGSNYVQLATTDGGQARCRTVVFRGYVQNLPLEHPCAVECDGLPSTMKMVTDLRSHKVSEIAKDSSAEMVWWFPKTSEQYRVQGRLVLVGGGPFEYDADPALGTARKELWGKVSDAARESFLDTAVPAAPFAPATQSPPHGGRDARGKVLPVPDNFLLLLLLPHKVDYLRLTNMYRQIDVYQDGQWSRQRVNP